MARLHSSRFYGGSAPSSVRRLTYPMLTALLGFDAARAVAREFAGKRIPPVEQLDPRRPDREEAARIHGRQIARLARQRAVARANSGWQLRSFAFSHNRIGGFAACRGTPDSPRRQHF